MTHIIKAEIGLKCLQAALRSAANLQEKTHFAFLFLCHPKAWSSKLGSVCEEGLLNSSLKPLTFISIFFLKDPELLSLIIK